jgi:hypothetical protein
MSSHEPGACDLVHLVLPFPVFPYELLGKLILIFGIIFEAGSEQIEAGSAGTAASRILSAPHAVADHHAEYIKGDRFSSEFVDKRRLE